MKVVLLAAGLGTRLRPITNHTPKCLVPINGKPLLDIWLNKLSANPQISEIFINLHYLAEEVVTHLKNHWSHLSHLVTWYEEELLGTAGTLNAHDELVCEEPIMVVHADNLSLFNLGAFIKAYSKRPAHVSMTMMLFECETPSSCGIVELSNNNTVIKMHEKVANPPSNLANAAVYIISQEVLALIKAAGYSDFSIEVIPEFYGRINTWLNTEYHRDIGTPDSLVQAQLDMTALELGK